MRGALSYNEQKVYKGEANILLASGFSCDISDLGFSEKLRRFQSLIERNEKVMTNTLHLSINFPSDEALSDSKMQQIAMEYMDKIGFADQPFLVYKHKDANHPHFHIITTNIRNDGSSISFHNLGKEKSEPARKAIEAQFGLIPAESRKKQQTIPMTSIANIVGEVVRSYKFSSFEEFNAILRQYNIAADQGLPGSRLRQMNGLIYSLLDKDGYKTGPPIKASRIYGKPTIKTLQRKFAANEVKKAGIRSSVKEAIEIALARSKTARKFAENLKRNNISLQINQDSLGIIQRIYFIDHRKKAVYTHQDLNMQPNDIYRLRAEEFNKNVAFEKNSKDPPDGGKSNSLSILPFETHSAGALIHALLAPYYSPPDSGEPVTKKKKKKRNGPSL
jgi:hypothetical protein